MSSLSFEWVFDGFCEQVSLEACSHVVLQPLATLQTVALWYLMRTRLKVLVLQSRGWNHGRPLPPLGQRRMSRGLRGGVMSRYWGQRRCCVKWYEHVKSNSVILTQFVFVIDASEVSTWTNCYGPTTPQTHIPSICWGIRPTSNNVSVAVSISLLYKKSNLHHTNRSLALIFKLEDDKVSFIACFQVLSLFEVNNSLSEIPLICLGILLSFRTPCKINPAVNMVLSSRKPCREETPLKRIQEHHQQQQEAESGKVQEQSMYCKELLLSGITEFSFEEVRAERYFKRMAQEVRGQNKQASTGASNWRMWKTLAVWEFFLDFLLHLDKGVPIMYHDLAVTCCFLSCCK